MSEVSQYVAPADTAPERRKAGDYAPEPLIFDPRAPVPSDPSQRAKMRLERLTASYGIMLATIAEMHQDEDWRYLTKDNGATYGSLGELLRDSMGVSQSMARRYIQGARDLYIPLSGLSVDGTVIEITSHDVAELGVDGAAEVVEKSQDRLDGVTDPDEAGGVIRDTIDETKSERSSARAPSSRDDDPWDDGDDDDSPAPSRGDGGYVETALEESDAEVTYPSPDGESSSGAGESSSDPMEKMMEGATTYETEAARRSLPADIRALIEAVVAVAEVDPYEVARMVSFETRGVLPHIDTAVRNLAIVQTATTTQPWFLANLTD